MNQLTICMIIFVLIIIGYMAGKFTMATTALLGMLLMMVTGCLSGETALSGFANSSTIIMACMFIVGAGLTRTQAVHKLSNLVYKISGGSFTKGLAGYVLVTFAIHSEDQHCKKLHKVILPADMALLMEKDHPPLLL